VDEDLADEPGVEIGGHGRTLLLIAEP
jgi:hypothetical protein